MLNRYVHGLSAGDDPLVQYAGSSVLLADATFLTTDARGSVIMAAQLGSLGGKKRAANMTPERRAEIGRNAAEKRWSGNRQE